MKASSVTRAIGWTTVIMGLTMAAFFAISGPRAFSGGQKPMILGMVGGLLLVLVGLRVVRRRRRHRKTS